MTRANWPQTFARCCSLLSARPPSRAQTRDWHRAADRFLILSRSAVVPVFAALAFLASFAGNQLSGRAAGLPMVAYFLAVGSWCAVNFARCREAHCLITGIGFAALAAATAISAGLDRDWRGPLWIAALAVLAAGALFETGWTARHGRDAVGNRRAVEQR
jgi:hypothetical protein